MAELKTRWNQLADSMAFPTPFASWEWSTAWAETLGRSTDLRLVLLERGGKLTGILPLATGQRAQLGRPLALCASEGIYPDHLAPIAAATEAPAIIEAAFAALRQQRTDWDYVWIPAVAEGSATLTALEQLAGRYPSEQQRISVAPYLPVSGTWEEFLSRLSSNERYKIRNRTKKLITGQGAEYVKLTDWDPVVALAKLRELHAKRSEQKGIESSFDIDAVQRFHERLLEIYPRDRLVFRGLRKDTDTFAMFYGFRVADRLFYFQLGYDPAWSDASPGLVLLSETIREAFQSGCVEYNFLQGDESFKGTWTKQTRVLHDFRIYRPSVRGRLYCELRHARFAVRSIILRALRRVGSPSRSTTTSGRSS